MRLGLHGVSGVSVCATPACGVSMSGGARGCGSGGGEAGVVVVVGRGSGILVGWRRGEVGLWLGCEIVGLVGWGVFW